jgi:hypothetical protein
LIFIFGHLFANYKAVKALIMRTFNRNRFHLFAQAYFGSAAASANDIVNAEPYLINKMEPVLFNVKRHFKTLNFGCSISQMKRLDKLQLARFVLEKYLIEFDMKSINRHYC